ncbi:transglycosylase domain-containing protein [Leptolyngbya sp. 7M]|uniref:transglycosylase domain-containing protein n=1 Tax=Leptolyngbya sp. 7M TaxID=2812896 RepID=UPI001B8D44C6|nr:transglycosylase domain-containing protein [Leptolyngbya sp. 7M]QYO65292.1 transglycosylase domain-containing protein [Leptolyngbya sp. 7M]
MFDLSSTHLDLNDPRNLQNRSEMVLYFAPFRFAKGDSISLDEVVEYLVELGYFETTDSQPGSFSRTASQIDAYPRNSLKFPKIHISFSSGKIASIEANGSSVESSMLEPMPLQNVVDYVAPEERRKNLRTRRIVIEPGTIPELVSDAVISTEDRTFYNNPGVDWLAVATRPIRSLGKAGGSSISQQLIKNNIVDGASGEFWHSGLGRLHRKFRTIERKAVEIPMAIELNRKMTKDEILASYLSMNYMGSPKKLGINLYGFEAASLEYFDKHLYEINDVNDPRSVAYAATLAGMIAAPGKYLKFIESGERCEAVEKRCASLLVRRNVVLNSMRETKPERYSDVVIENAKNTPLGFVFSSARRTNRPVQIESINFAKFAASNSELPKEISGLRTESGQVELVTSLDVRLQKVAAEIVSKAKKDLEKKVERIYGEQRSTNEEKFNAIERQCLAAEVANPSKCDSIFKIQASLVAIDARTGQILAMSTGIGPWDKRNPGSLTKPFFYLKALEEGTFKGEPFTAATIINPKTDKSLLNDYCSNDENLGGIGTAKSHLAMSWNIGACFAAQSTGIPTEFVGRLTGSSPEKKVLASIGGTKGSEVSLLDIVQAYTIFPNNGRMMKLTPYEEAYQTERDKVTPIRFSTHSFEAVADPVSTFITAQMLRSVITEGTGRRFRELTGSVTTNELAGKTGSGMVADLWWVHFTPRMVVGVWVGMPYNLPELHTKDGFSGGATAGPIAAEFTNAVNKLRPDLLRGHFIQPQGVVRLPVDAGRGCIGPVGGESLYFNALRRPKTCS